MRKVIVAVFLMIASGISLHAADDACTAFVDECVGLLIRGGHEQCYERLDASKKNPSSAQGLKQISDMFLNQKVDSRALLSSSRTDSVTMRGDRRVIYRRGYEYDIGGRYYLVQTVVRESGGEFRLTGFNVEMIPVHAGRLNRFSFAGKGPVHYMFIAMMVLVPVFMLGTLVALFVSPVRRKWLWAPFLLAGIMQFSLNWGTGKIAFSLLHIQLFGAGFGKIPIYAPYTMTFSVPVGAILFWIHWRKTRARGSSAELPPADGASGGSEKPEASEKS